MARVGALIKEQAGFGLVLLLGVASVVALIVAPQHWRYGVAIMALALLVGGVLRVVLPESMQGELRVRRARWADAVIYLGTGILVVAALLLLHG